MVQTEVIVVNNTFTFKMGRPNNMHKTAHNHTTFAGTLYFGCTLRQILEKGMPPSRDKA
jgi:hypothetical protein